MPAPGRKRLKKDPGKKKQPRIGQPHGFFEGPMDPDIQSRIEKVKNSAELDNREMVRLADLISKELARHGPLRKYLREAMIQGKDFFCVRGGKIIPLENQALGAFIIPHLLEASLTDH